MAGEISFSGSLTVFKPSVMGTPTGLSVTGLLANLSGNLITRGILSVTLAAIAIPLGGLTTLGWAAFHNTDTVNFCTIRNGSGGADVVELLPGEWAFFRLPPACVPFAVANTAPVLLDFMIAAQ